VYMWFLGKALPHPNKRKVLWELLDRLAATATT